MYIRRKGEENLQVGDKNWLKDFKWDDIETVFLDMDGTLLDRYFDDYFWEHLLPEEYARRNHLDIQKARRQLLTRYKEEEGKLTWMDLDFWSKELDIDIPALKEQVHHLISIHPYGEDFLQFLHRSGKGVYLVTNAHYKTLDLKLKKTEIGKYFDSIISAFDMGIPKEESSFWRKMADRINFHKDSTLLIDDTEKVLISARDYGIRYLILLARPSSRGEIKTSEEFPTISYFNEIFP